MKIKPEWLAGQTVIDAAVVKKMPVGTLINYHTTRNAQHEVITAKIVQYGKKKRIAYKNYHDLTMYRPIKSADVYTLREGEA